MSYYARWAKNANRVGTNRGTHLQGGGHRTEILGERPSLPQRQSDYERRAQNFIRSQGGAADIDDQGRYWRVQPLFRNPRMPRRGVPAWMRPLNSNYVREGEEAPRVSEMYKSMSTKNMSYWAGIGAAYSSTGLPLAHSTQFSEDPVAAALERRRLSLAPHIAGSKGGLQVSALAFHHFLHGMEGLHNRDRRPLIARGAIGQAQAEALAKLATEASTAASLDTMPLGTMRFIDTVQLKSAPTAAAFTTAPAFAVQSPTAVYVSEAPLPSVMDPSAQSARERGRTTLNHVPAFSRAKQHERIVGSREDRLKAQWADGGVVSTPIPILSAAAAGESYQGTSHSPAANEHSACMVLGSSWVSNADSESIVAPVWPLTKRAIVVVMHLRPAHEPNMKFFVLRMKAGDAMYVPRGWECRFGVEVAPESQSDSVSATADARLPSVATMPPIPLPLPDAPPPVHLVRWAFDPIVDTAGARDGTAQRSPDTPIYAMARFATSYGGFYLRGAARAEAQRRGGFDESEWAATSLMASGVGIRSTRADPRLSYLRSSA